MLMTQGAQMEPGSLKGLQLVVPELRAARDQLAERGVEVSEVQVIDGGPPRLAEPDEQLDHRGFVFLEDPDGVMTRLLPRPARRRPAAIATAAIELNAALRLRDAWRAAGNHEAGVEELRVRDRPRTVGVGGQGDS